MITSDNQIIQVMNNPRFTATKSMYMCTRGLEARTWDGSIQKNRNKFEAREVVLDEQDYQWENEIMDAEETLAGVYFELSKRTQEQAHKRGLQDEQYVGENVLSHVTLVLPPKMGKRTNVDVRRCTVDNLSEKRLVRKVATTAA
jgi:hypothetical protein